uniref:(northern house mosquito) hypothetical protein n=1 Tax=Culex pipiens TaxID=7175 RepID=A0A8D8FIG0_CULPI
MRLKKQKKKALRRCLWMNGRPSRIKREPKWNSTFVRQMRELTGRKDTFCTSPRLRMPLLMMLLVTITSANLLMTSRPSWRLTLEIWAARDVVEEVHEVAEVAVGRLLLPDHLVNAGQTRSEECLSLTWTTQRLSQPWLKLHRQLLAHPGGSLLHGSLSKRLAC